MMLDGYVDKTEWEDTKWDQDVEIEVWDESEEEDKEIEELEAMEMDSIPTDDEEGPDWQEKGKCKAKEDEEGPMDWWKTGLERFPDSGEEKAMEWWKMGPLRSPEATLEDPPMLLAASSYSGPRPGENNNADDDEWEDVED